MKEKEYKDALEAFNEKNKEKSQLVNKLMEFCEPNFVTIDTSLVLCGCGCVQVYSRLVFVHIFVHLLLMLCHARKEVATVRKRIDVVNRELKPLGQSSRKKEKEYKDALEAFNEKNKEKSQLVNKLIEVPDMGL
ncbi:uncharacterized protein LOC109834529 [Asparagus officinalis]|uniref:uncharacterized protein LOC109834529 n=1 Tax=Asparagus officinalis TaxID=4686 RepID=UPI00098E389E|nr:uncharacterized protein LOC109834529 [Asparagus officinalis]